jgi:cyanophycinase-like exopeptidase
MGSGETSPTMVNVHKMLVSRLGASPPEAIVLATPYAFQENAADVSAKARSYFARSVGLDVTVLAGSGTGSGTGGDDGVPARLRAADWLFAGPGSPTYALSRWRSGPVGDALRDRVTGGTGVTILASAAAATAGAATLPVYEIYKAGAEPHWLDGLDLLAALDLPVALIPHYDNAEGGTHDTRYCYLGERRLSAMERDLPPGTAVLGVDEHTAVVFDLGTGTAEVRGRGGLTIRRHGVSTIVRAPAMFPVAQLSEAVRNGAGTAVSLAPRPSPTAPDHGPALPPLPQLIRDAERRFGRAARGHDAAGMVGAILDLEAAIHDWAADTEEDQGTGRARAVLRVLITRLGDIARDGLRDPGDGLRPAVGPLLELRSSLRAQGRYRDADVIRDALTAAGLAVHDTPEGTRWRPPARTGRVSACGTPPSMPGPAAT